MSTFQSWQLNLDLSISHHLSTFQSSQLSHSASTKIQIYSKFLVLTTRPRSLTLILSIDFSVLTTRSFSFNHSNSFGLNLASISINFSILTTRPRTLGLTSFVNFSILRAQSFDFLQPQISFNLLLLIKIWLSCDYIDKRVKAHNNYYK